MCIHICLEKAERYTFTGGWLDQLRLKLSQLPTKLKLKLKLSLAKGCLLKIRALLIINVSGHPEPEQLFHLQKYLLRGQCSFNSIGHW